MVSTLFNVTRKSTFQLTLYGRCIATTSTVAGVNISIIIIIIIIIILYCWQLKFKAIVNTNKKFGTIAETVL